MEFWASQAPCCARCLLLNAREQAGVYHLPLPPTSAYEHLLHRGRGFAVSLDATIWTVLADLGPLPRSIGRWPRAATGIEKTSSTANPGRACRSPLGLGEIEASHGIHEVEIHVDPLVLTAQTFAALLNGSGLEGGSAVITESSRGSHSCRAARASPVSTSSRSPRRRHVRSC